MKKENSYDFQKKLLAIHEPDLRRKDKNPAGNQLELKDGLCVAFAPIAGKVIETAASDFADFLAISMGFSKVRVVKELIEEGGSVCIYPVSQERYANLLGEANRYKGFLIRVTDRIEIYAYDERGAAQALYYLEDMMSFEHAPFIKKEEIRKYAMFSPQMIHSGYALDEYPDEYLAKVAHEGRDAILVFTKDVNKTPGGYLDFNDLINRAARYGLDVYAYSYLLSNMSPEAPEAEEFYENSYGRLFRECPGLAGVTLVGESVEFPSKDPHVAKGRYCGNDSDGIPSGKVSAGWYPCEDYPVWLNLVKKIIRKYKSDADIVFWTYNWGYQPEEARIKLIESLPTDISLQATFEMFEPRQYGAYQAHCADYTLTFEGPGKYFRSEAAAAKKRGIRLYSMTNTGGLTWDIGVIPYEPMPFQWIRRYEGMRKAHDEWGLCGIMESHHFGFYPSFISKLSKWCFMEPREDCEKIAQTVIEGIFGSENYMAADKALRLWSEAIRCYTATDADQYGAFRVGPAYPFCLDRKISVQADPKAMFGGGICNTSYPTNADKRDSLISLRLPEEINALSRMQMLLQEGITLLEEAPEQNDKLKELINLGKFILRTVITGIHAKQWHKLKCKLQAAEEKETVAEILDKMEVLIQAEKENVQETIPLVEADSRLGWEPSMLYVGDGPHLEWKLRQLEALINIEIAAYRESLRK